MSTSKHAPRHATGGADKKRGGKDKRPRKEKPVLAEPVVAADAGNSNFARALGSTDYLTREKGLQALQRWMCLKSDLGEGDMLKIWKGLFFCFWHSDKAPVQADLAQRLAGLLPQLPPDTAALYFGCFLATMRREWFAIDYHRLDKYLMLVRRFLVAALALLRDNGWDPALVAQYAGLLQRRVVVPPGDPSNRAAGLVYHVADIFVPELRNCVAPPPPPAAADKHAEPALAGRKRARGGGGGGAAGAAQQQQVPGAAAAALLAPFTEALRALPEKAAVDRIRASVFEELASEVAEPSEGEPLGRLDAAALAAALFDLGAAPEVRARNREALYAASAALEAATKRAGKRQRKAAGEGAAAAAAAGQRPETAAGGGSKRKAAAEAAAAAGGDKKSKKAAAKAAAAAVAAAEEGARQAAAAEAPRPAKKAAAAVAGTPVTPKQQHKAQEREAAAAAAAAAAPAGTPGSSKKGSKAAKGEEASGKGAAKPKPSPSTPVQQQQGRGGGGGGEEQRQLFSTPQPQRRGGGAAAAGGGAAHPGGAQSVPPKGRELRSDTKPPASAKKGVVINLRKNIYHKHGAPPPAADVRTPPSAKPKGSALKVKGTPERRAAAGGKGAGAAAAPATAQPASRTASRLSVGGGGGPAAPGSAPPKMGGGGGGGRVTPGRVARPKASSFF